MHDLIGSTAGKVWSFLDVAGSADLIQIKSELGISNALLHLALGWLLRENKVLITNSGHVVTAALKK